MWLDHTQDLAVCADCQVYRAIRGGVQDVVVKVLTHSTNLARQDLRKVRFQVCSLLHSLTMVAAFPMMPHVKTGANNSCLQEVDVLKSVSYDRNVVQFYGTCPLGSQTMLVLEYMEVTLSALSLLLLWPAHVIHHSCHNNRPQNVSPAPQSCIRSCIAVAVSCCQRMLPLGAHLWDLWWQGGDLRHALTNCSNGELQWRKKGAAIALDLVRGLHFLHSHGVRHALCRHCILALCDARV